MATLQVQDLRLAFGDRDILDGISFILTDQSRAALCGSNGSGKSTLLKALCGIIQPDHLDLSKTKGLTTVYLPQSEIVMPEGTVYDEVEKGYARFQALLDEKERIGSRLAQLTEGENGIGLANQLHGLEEELLSSGYYSRKQKIYQVLKGLGFDEADYGRQCGEFSGGWQMRIALARTLVANATIMFLDEPTNYLDIDALTWLKNFLASYKGGLMIVSHDQGFLDQVVTEVYELFQGKLKRYSGNYTQYQRQREQEIAQLEAAYKSQQETIAKNEQFIERFRYKATKSKAVQSRIKQMEKLEPVVVPDHLKRLVFSFPPAPHSGNDVVKVDHLRKAFGEHEIFHDLSFQVQKGDRLAITGRNGAGKSTLLRMLVGQDKDYSGSIVLGAGVTVGYFAQETETTLDPKNTVLDELASVAATDDLPKLRSYLGSFLFQGDDVFKQVSVLSGGERSRLALLKILLHPVNLLVLDEPTNHLDINAKQMLLEALKQYDGTLVCVSHDSYFLKGISKRIMYLSKDEQPVIFDGDWDYFMYKLNEKEKYEETSQTSQAKATTAPSAGSLGYQERNKLRNRIQNLARECDKLLAGQEKLEEEIHHLEERMNDPAIYSDSGKIGKVMAEKEAKEAAKAASEEAWFAKSEELEELKRENGEQL
ncbi:MAG: ABC-F family ATP-binding cassette domain-containing protein [Sphaerochaetaceae bacterium]|nr:ABC-F family ATP-binding cassette domain-containing protein [Spirochaetales bacterium]MDY5498961.1 ABC-F family ATP-binding cassette domain-containing protein [Sphaerochaetaceae bacterium]